MALDPIEPAVLDFILQVECLYAKLMAVPGLGVDTDHGLGGKLIYTGDLDPVSRALLVAANIAGAATLAVSADQARQKQAVKEGVIDFLVTSLSEALRILKNQVRKRESVAVCIAGQPNEVEREMQDRGLLPDLIASELAGSPASQFWIAKGARRIELASVEPGQARLIWHVSGSPTKSMAALDAIVVDCLARDKGLDRATPARWLRLSSRYLGRLAQGVRVLRCDPQVAKEFVARAQRAVENGEIGVAVRCDYRDNDAGFNVQFTPTAAAGGVA